MTAKAGRTVQEHLNSSVTERINRSISTSAARDDVTPRTTVDDVITIIAKQRVGARKASQTVITRPTFKDVIGGRTRQHICKRRTRDMLNRYENVILRVTASPSRTVQRDRHRTGRCAIVNLVETRTAIDGIAAGTAVNDVITRLAAQDVCAGKAEENVIAIAGKNGLS